MTSEPKKYLLRRNNEESNWPPPVDVLIYAQASNWKYPRKGYITKFVSPYSTDSRPSYRFTWIERNPKKQWIMAYPHDLMYLGLVE